MTSRIFASIAAALILAACSGDDEIDALSTALLAQIPRGLPFGTAVKRIQALGYTCYAGQVEVRGADGEVRKAEAHLRCQREEPFLYFCSKRTSVILIQSGGHLVNLLVNIGRC